MLEQLNRKPADLVAELAADLTRRARELDARSIDQLALLVQVATASAVYATKAKAILAEPLRKAGIAINGTDWRSCGLALYGLWQKMTPAEVEARMAELGAASRKKWFETFPKDTWDVDEKTLTDLYADTPPLLANGIHGLSDASLALRYYVAEMLAPVANRLDQANSPGGNDSGGAADGRAADGGAFDWGGADGVTCTFLKSFGCRRVSLIEMSNSGREFARWFNSQLSAGEFEILPDRPARKFGAGICTEVLEHVVDPPKMIRQMYDMLLPGGVMFVTSSYTVPQDTHLKSNLKYGGKEKQLMLDAGFKVWPATKHPPLPFLESWGFWQKPT